MKHLFSYSVYQDLNDIGKDLQATFSRIRCDGLETLTSHEAMDPVYHRHTVSVHLPFATDWLAAWEGRAYEMSEYYSKYYMYGRDRDEVMATIRNMIEMAAPAHPEHGVIHASNVDLTELRKRSYSLDSNRVLRTFCEMMNASVADFPGGEPPFKLAFENLWWPGLRLQSDSDYRLLEKHLEFENWGICLDTGHLMNTLPVYTEQDGIEALLRIFDGYSQDLIDSIGGVHFHYSASGRYRETFEEAVHTDGPINEYIAGSYHHISTLDQHLPFSDPRCKELIDILQPDLVIHELPGHGHDPLLDYVQQRSLLDRTRYRPLNRTDPKQPSILPIKVLYIMLNRESRGISNGTFQRG